MHPSDDVAWLLAKLLQPGAMRYFPVTSANWLPDNKQVGKAISRIRAADQFAANAMIYRYQVCRDESTAKRNIVSEVAMHHRYLFASIIMQSMESVAAGDI